MAPLQPLAKRRQLWTVPHTVAKVANKFRSSSSLAAALAEHARTAVAELEAAAAEVDAAGGPAGQPTPPRQEQQAAAAAKAAVLDMPDEVTIPEDVTVLRLAQLLGERRMSIARCCTLLRRRLAARSPPPACIDSQPPADRQRTTHLPALCLLWPPRLPAPQTRRLSGWRRCCLSWGRAWGRATTWCPPTRVRSGGRASLPPLLLLPGGCCR